jgi:hypothetical protein
VALGYGTLLWYGHDKLQQGVAQESARRDAIDRQRDEAAKAELARLNAEVYAAREQLAAAQGQVEQLTKEVHDAKAVSSERESRLRAGVERERVLIRAIGTGTNPAPGADSSAGTGAVDSGSGSTSVTLDPAVAGDLERVRVSRNTAIAAAKACVIEYDALKHAVDSTGR